MTSITGTPIFHRQALVIDLDRDLLGGNLAGEAFWAAIRTDWRAAVAPARRQPGRAGLDIARLPYDKAVLAEVRAARAAGTPTVLTAGTDLALAEAVARHLGCFDRTEAASAPGAARKPRARNPVAGPALRAMRPHQWVKNVLVFLPMIADHSYAVADCRLDPAGLCRLRPGRLGGLRAERSDRPARRPAPPDQAGAPLRLRRAAALGRALDAAGAARRRARSRRARWAPGLLAVMVLYTLATTAYSMKLKGSARRRHHPARACSTPCRIIAGAVGHRDRAVDVAAQLLDLPVPVARSGQTPVGAGLHRERGRARTRAAGRAYTIEDRPVMAMIATSAGFLSVLVLALYIDSARGAAACTAARRSCLGLLPGAAVLDQPDGAARPPRAGRPGPGGLRPDRPGEPDSPALVIGLIFVAAILG